MLFIGIFDIEFIFLPTQFPSLLPGVFLACPPFTVTNDPKRLWPWVWFLTPFKLSFFSSYFWSCANIQKFNIHQNININIQKTPTISLYLLIMVPPIFFSWPYIQYSFGGLRPLQNLCSQRLPPFQNWIGVLQPVYKIHFPLVKIKMVCINLLMIFIFPPPLKSLQNYFSGTWHFDDFQDNFIIVIIIPSDDLVLPPPLPTVQNEFGDVDLCNIGGC
jgi:hypothetical protein